MKQNNYKKPVFSVIVMSRSYFLAASQFGNDGVAGNVFNEGNTNYYEDL